LTNWLKNAESLVKNGTKELILIAQDLTYYGLDLYGKRNLDELLRRLSDVNGVEWIGCNTPTLRVSRWRYWM
jgi:ribosomal protein S12 methylthiotransferase